MYKPNISVTSRYFEWWYEILGWYAPGPNYSIIALRSSKKVCSAKSKIIKLYIFLFFPCFFYFFKSFFFLFSLPFSFFNFNPLPGRHPRPPAHVASYENALQSNCRKLISWRFHKKLASTEDAIKANLTFFEYSHESSLENQTIMMMIMKLKPYRFCRE